MTLAFVTNNQIGSTSRNIGNSFSNHLLGSVKGLLMINEVCGDFLFLILENCVRHESCREHIGKLIIKTETSP